MERIPREHLFAAAGYYLGIKPDENDVEFIVGAIPVKRAIFGFSQK